MCWRGLRRPIVGLGSDHWAGFQVGGITPIPLGLGFTADIPS